MTGAMISVTRKYDEDKCTIMVDHIESIIGYPDKSGICFASMLYMEVTEPLEVLERMCIKAIRNVKERAVYMPVTAEHVQDVEVQGTVIEKRSAPY